MLNYAEIIFVHNDVVTTQHISTNIEFQYYQHLIMYFSNDMIAAAERLIKRKKHYSFYDYA